MQYIYLEDDMLGRLFFCATFTGRRGCHIPHLYKQERKRPTPVQRRSKSDPCCFWQDHSRRVDADVGDESTESRGVVQLLRIPLVIRPLRRTYVVVVR